MIVTIGGASVGDHDLVAPVLEARGMALSFWKIAMRPGKPLMFGRLGGSRVLGVPGNPVSSLVCARIFLVPLIHALLGRPDRGQGLLQARTTVDLEANGPRPHYMRATTKPGADGFPQVTPVRSQDSSLLAPLALADCLLVRPVDAPLAPAGSPVRSCRSTCDPLAGRTNALAEHDANNYGVPGLYGSRVGSIAPDPTPMGKSMLRRSKKSCWSSSTPACKTRAFRLPSTR